MPQPKASNYEQQRRESFLHRIEEISKLTKHAAYVVGYPESEGRLIDDLTALCVNLKNDRVVAKMPRPLM